ncbi:MAG TPA: alpha/beta fold hydrolase [Desulfomonilia bacterium]|nr:alpha/beta fold hydrolase [Desulfomonilia bacterium]
MQTLVKPDMPDWINDMLPEGVSRKVVDVGGQLMHVMEWGEGMPVLMLHGNPTWGFLYRKIVHHLRDMQLHCIVPDLIGLGFSGKPRSMKDHSLLNHAAWLGSFVDSLSLDGMILVCQDWGGPIGVRTMADRPHLLKGLVVLNTALRPPHQGFRPTLFHRFSNLPLISDFVFRLLGFPQNILHRVQGDPSSIQGKVAQAYRYPLRRISDRIAPLALARMVPSSLTHPSVRELEVCEGFIRTFKGPGAMVWGDKDPILGRVLKRMTELMPDAPVQRTNAGHFIQEEEPEAIAGAIREVYRHCTV